MAVMTVSHPFLISLILNSLVVSILSDCIIEPENDRWDENLLRVHMEGSWKLNEELSAALGVPGWLEELK